ncbi:uncharacterized protein LOC130724935 [Lotus japonicus]|uniref:uncharacterized protein LOC130724935 n=1 Tax=Lotus japonicus TaxID=34305 RepID=UPI00258A6D2F|nr:uncharacterized protein LOC130724935 [Lotus japonicus]
MDGGQGFRDFKAFNMTLVGKNWWRMHRNPDLLLSRVYQSVYFPRGDLWNARKGGRPNYAWSSLWKTRWLFDEESVWRVGNGKTIRVSDNRWLPQGSPLVYREEEASTLGVVHVSNLMLPGRMCWNADLIRHIFWPPTAEGILKIPLPMVPRDDVMAWPHTINGEYTSKSGYVVARNKVLHGTSSSSLALQVPPVVWKVLWSTHTLPRCRELIWRGCLKILPTRGALCSRGLDVDDLCPWCAVQPKTAAHEIFFCPVVKRWWFASSLGLRLDDEMEFHEFVAEFFSRADEGCISRFCELCYIFWEARNRLVFDGVVHDGVVVFASCLACQPTSKCFSCPSSSGAASFGFIARNENGEVLAAATKPAMACLSPLLAEAEAFRWNMGLALELGFRVVMMERDCKALHDAWFKKDKGCSYLFSVISDCNDLASSFASFGFYFVRRTGNKVVDLLAKHAGDFGDSVRRRSPLLHAVCP